MIFSKGGTDIFKGGTDIFSKGGKGRPATWLLQMLFRNKLLRSCYIVKILIQSVSSYKIGLSLDQTIHRKS